MVACGPDPAVHLAKIQEYVDAGFDHVYIHQVGPDQRGFIEFYERSAAARVEETQLFEHCLDDPSLTECSLGSDRGSQPYPTTLHGP